MPVIRNTIDRNDFDGSTIVRLFDNFAMDSVVTDFHKMINTRFNPVDRLFVYFFGSCLCNAFADCVPTSPVSAVDIVGDKSPLHSSRHEPQP